MIRYRAAWVLPITRPPIRNGTIAVDNGRIVAVGDSGFTTNDSRLPTNDSRLPTIDSIDLGNVAVVPGLVNAHTHLELSYMRDAIPSGAEFTDWIRSVIRTRRTKPDPQAPEIVDAVEAGIRDSIACGTALVGDISNTLVTVKPLIDSTLNGVVFFELLRFHAAGAGSLIAEVVEALDAQPQDDDVRLRLAAHAPYSVAPALFQAMRALPANRIAPRSVHLSESASEVEFLKTATGPWRALLDEIGAWDPAFTAPGVSPVEHLDHLGFLDRDAVVVHGVQMSDSDLALLAARGATLVACPRSNRHTGAGTPPIERFYASGVRVAVGTDSLASTPDLNVFAELAALRAAAPAVPASALLASATRQGAEALGFGNDYGTIEAGKRAKLLAVSLPPDAGGVEEYLVSGIRPDQVRWVD